MAGYIKLYRGWRDCAALTAPSKFSEPEAWLWIIENAAWKDMTRTGGQGQPVLVRTGCIHVSERSLATAWGWDRKRIRRFLERLERHNMLSRDCPKKGTSSGTSSGTSYCVVNWAKFQKQGPDGGPDDGQKRDQFGTTQEEGKEDKEGKNHTRTGEYAFSGSVIRLTKKDFETWQKGFPDLDLRAQLLSRDAYLSERPEAERKRWFVSTASVLAKKQQEIVTERKSENDDGPTRIIV